MPEYTGQRKPVCFTLWNEWVWLLGEFLEIQKSSEKGLSCLRDNKPLWLPVCKFGNLNVYSATKNFITKNKYYFLEVAISEKSQFNTMNEIWDIFYYNPLSTHHLHIVSQVHEAFTHPQIHMFFQISANSSRKRKAKFTHCVKTVRIRSYSGPIVGKCGFRIRTLFTQWTTQ